MQTAKKSITSGSPHKGPVMRKTRMRGSFKIICVSHLNHWQCRKSSGSLNARWYLMRMTYDATLSQADDMSKSSVNHPDALARSDISSGWFRVSAVCRVDDIWRRPKSPGWLVRLSSWRYLIRITYDQCSMSSGWIKMLPHAIEMTWWYLILMTNGQCRMSSDGLWCYHKLSGWQRNLNLMSSGRLSSWPYLIRMTYGIMQYLIRMTCDATLNHMDDKTTFDWVFRILANPTLSLGHG